MRTDCLKQIEEEADNGCSENPQFRVASKNDVLAHFHQTSVQAVKEVRNNPRMQLSATMKEQGWEEVNMWD